MGFKFTRHFLKKLEELMEDLTYTVRYEKGHFQSGYCIVENKKVAIINKFYDTEGRINVLLDILSTIQIEKEQLSEKTAQLYAELRKNYFATEEPLEPSNDQ